MDGRESFVVGGRIGFSGLALNRFGPWALRGGPSVATVYLLRLFLVLQCYMYFFPFSIFRFLQILPIFQNIIQAQNELLPFALPTGRVCHGCPSVFFSSRIGGIPGQVNRLCHGFRHGNRRRAVCILCMLMLLSTEYAVLFACFQVSRLTWHCHTTIQ